MINNASTRMMPVGQTVTEPVAGPASMMPSTSSTNPSSTNGTSVAAAYHDDPIRRRHLIVAPTSAAFPTNRVLAPATSSPAHLPSGGFLRPGDAFPPPPPPAPARAFVPPLPRAPAASASADPWGTAAMLKRPSPALVSPELDEEGQPPRKRLLRAGDIETRTEPSSVTSPLSGSPAGSEASTPSLDNGQTSGDRFRTMLNRYRLKQKDSPTPSQSPTFPAPNLTNGSQPYPPLSATSAPSTPNLGALPEEDESPGPVRALKRNGTNGASKARIVDDDDDDDESPLPLRPSNNARPPPSTARLPFDSPNGALERFQLVMRGHNRDPALIERMYKECNGDVAMATQRLLTVHSHSAPPSPEPQRGPVRKLVSAANRLQMPISSRPSGVTVVTKTIHKAAPSPKSAVLNHVRTNPVVISSSPAVTPVGRPPKRKAIANESDSEEFDEFSQDRYEALDDEEALTTAWSFFNDCKEEEFLDITGGLPLGSLYGVSSPLGPPQPVPPRSSKRCLVSGRLIPSRTSGPNCGRPRASAPTSLIRLWKLSG